MLTAAANAALSLKTKRLAFAEPRQLRAEATRPHIAKARQVLCELRRNAQRNAQRTNRVHRYRRK